MTALAITGNATMIHARRQPATGGMTGNTVCTGGNMRTALAGSRGAVMTAFAITGDTAVIHAGGQPGHRIMAKITLQRGNDMPR